MRGILAISDHTTPHIESDDQLFPVSDVIRGRLRLRCTSTVPNPFCAAILSPPAGGKFFTLLVL